MFGFFNKGDKSHDSNTKDKNIVYTLNNDNGDVVYVGSSRRGTERAHEHTDKNYSSCNYETINPNDMLKEERAYIKNYEPTYNKDGGSDTRSLSNSDGEINTKRFS
jgi:hypothetical protein